MKHQPPHLYLDNTIYFVTARTFKKQLVLQSPERRTEFIKKILEEFAIYGFKIYSWVIQRDHYHCLFRTNKGRDLSTLIHHLHGKTAFLWNREDQTPGRTVWQNYFDTCIRDEKQFYTHLNYTHHNPVKHGYAQKMEDYAWSSYKQYLKKYGQNWLDSCFEKYPIIDFTPADED